MDYLVTAGRQRVNVILRHRLTRSLIQQMHTDVQCERALPQDDRTQPAHIPQLQHLIPGQCQGFYQGDPRHFQVRTAGQDLLALHPVVGKEEFCPCEVRGEAHFKAGRGVFMQQRVQVMRGTGKRGHTRQAGRELCRLGGRDIQPVALFRKRIGRQTHPRGAGADVREGGEGGVVQ